MSEQLEASDEERGRLAEVVLAAWDGWPDEMDGAHPAVTIAVAVSAAGYRKVGVIEEMVSTVEDLDALPVGAVVLSDAGTIACRFDEHKFVCFGDDRPGEPWSMLALPARVLYRPAALGGGD